MVLNSFQFFMKTPCLHRVNTYVKQIKQSYYEFA